MTTTEPKPMETLQQAVHRLEGRGFTGAFRAVAGGQLEMRASDGTSRPKLSAERMTVEEVVRFEGQSDPGDEAVIFALCTPDRERGLFVATYGPQMDAACVAVVERLDADPADRGRRA